MGMRSVQMLIFANSFWLAFPSTIAASNNIPYLRSDNIPKSDAKIADLGEQLFNDPILSQSQAISCSTCHNLSRGGVDGLRFSIGHSGEQGELNAPTVFNAALNFRQFWDGRAASLEEQIEGPINDKKEMASNWPQIITRLNASAKYKPLFKSLFKDGINSTNIKFAIAEFERTLVTPSRYDRYLSGEKDALTLTEIKGFQTFQKLGCQSCHQGINLGGNMYQVFGITGNYFNDRGSILPADLGRFRVTRKEKDKHVFKVPTLRNVALTAPYFHDGSASTLKEAIETMAKYQLGRSLQPADSNSILTFLNTLNGTYKGKAL